MRVIRRIGILSAFGIGAFFGWLVCIFMCVMGGKSVEKWIQQELAKKPAKVTVD